MHQSINAWKYRTKAQEVSKIMKQHSSENVFRVLNLFMTIDKPFLSSILYSQK